MNHHHHHGDKKPLTATAAKVVNEQRTCMASGCSETREGLNNYCKAHTRTYNRYGHYKARPIRATEYLPYRKPIKELFTANSTHPGLIAALHWVSNWLQQATADEQTFKGANELARIVRNGATAEDVLIEVCAVYCYVMDRPRSLPDSKSEAIAMSRAVFALAPRPRRYTHESLAKKTNGYPLRARFSGLNTVGTQLRDVLAFLLANVHQSIATRDQQEADTLKALRAPLSFPVAALVATAVPVAPLEGPSGLPFSPSTTQQPA